MPKIDHASIKRISADKGLESITLRSDLAARYTFLNETLLEGIGAVEVDSKFKSSVDLHDVVTEQDGMPIVDEHAYLEKWEARLQEEVALLEKQQATATGASAVVAGVIDSQQDMDPQLVLIQRLDGPFTNEDEVDAVVQ